MKIEQLVLKRINYIYSLEIITLNYKIFALLDY